MNVIILKNAQSFAGVNYSEKKNEKGQSELLIANNFPPIIKDRLGYLKYMTAVSQLNKRVKYPQFHAVLSSKGKEETKEELKECANKFVEKMGYKDVPYLIYFHNDTNNNHVHIVASRVNKSGKKIDDSFEKVKSQKVLDEILERNLTHNKNISDYLNYNFSTENQFKQLLENQDYNIKESKKNLNVFYANVHVFTVSKADLNNKIKSFKKDKERTRQLKAILLKYNNLEISEFKKTLKESFGIDLIFYKKENMKPYGYVLIDNKTKSVYKGSQVLNINNLLNLQKIKNINSIDLISEYKISKDLSRKKEIEKLNQINLKRFCFSDLKTINKFCNFFNINMSDFLKENKNDVIKLEISELNFYENIFKTKDFKKSDIDLIKINDEYLILDNSENKIFTNKELGINITYEDEIRIEEIKNLRSSNIENCKFSDDLSKSILAQFHRVNINDVKDVNKLNNQELSFYKNKFKELNLTSSDSFFAIEKNGKLFIKDNSRNTFFSADSINVNLDKELLSKHQIKTYSVNAVASLSNDSTILDGFIEYLESTVKNEFVQKEQDNKKSNKKTKNRNR